MVLDEVGLAEDSPSLPLKTLHPLLEDGTTKSQDVSLAIVSYNFCFQVNFNIAKVFKDENSHGFHVF